MALGLKAVDIERAAAGYGDLRRVEAPELDLAGPEPAGAEECLSADDILDFGEGRLPPPRSSSVQRHLELCSICMDLVSLAINDWQPQQPVEWLDVASNFRVGDRIDDRYEIRRFIASGGMGEVYEALDTRTARRVALKAVLAASSDNRQMLRSFRREARLGRRIRHPNVCFVHAPAGADAAPHPLVPYFTMDLIDGETLNERLRRERLGVGAALRVARQLLEGLSAIHAAGIIHLDIKGGNVMLRDGSLDDVVILDFGLARRTDGDSHAERLRPLTGSLAYMPPEQILGHAPSLQNDIFAFGVVLFQMLTSEFPFPAPQTSTPSSIVHRLTTRAPKPSSLAPETPDWLDELVLRCLAEPSERYANVEAVLEALGPAYPDARVGGTSQRS